MVEHPSRIRPYALGLAIVSALARLLPHPPNFTPVGGASLFAGARLNGWLAYAIPIAVMAATDPLRGGYTAATPFVYIALLLNVLIGRSLRRTNSPVRIGAAATICSVIFYLLSNVPAFFQLYPHTMSGLWTCYVDALPFFGRTLAGDLFTTAVLFALHFALTRTVARNERAVAIA